MAVKSGPLVQLIMKVANLREDSFVSKNNQPLQEKFCRPGEDNPVLVFESFETDPAFLGVLRFGTVRTFRFRRERLQMDLKTRLPVHLTDLAEARFRGHEPSGPALPFQFCQPDFAFIHDRQSPPSGSAHD